MVEAQRQAFSGLGFAALLALALVYMVLASQFGSLVDPLVIMFSVPLGVAGVIVALLLFFGLVKFVLVVSYFMHLKTDQPIFRRFFTMGAIAAVVLYLIALTTLHVF